MDTETEGLVLIGAEDAFATDVLETLLRLDHKVVAAVLNGMPKWEVSPVPVVLQSDDVSDMLAGLPAVIGSNEPRQRRSVRDYAADSGFAVFPSIVDPTAILAGTTRVEDGAYINVGAAMGGHTVIEEFAVVNRNASLGHHSVLESFAMLGPGAVVASNSRICEGALVGAGAVIRPDTVVGPGSVVGAGAVVVEEVAANVVVAGNPARAIGEVSGWSETAA